MTIQTKTLAVASALACAFVGTAALAEGEMEKCFGVALAGQNYVVAINRGTQDGLEPGHVLAIQKAGRRVVDRSQANERTELKLPDERNGVMMVFRTFDKVSYALVLEILEPISIGDHFTAPR